MFSPDATAQEIFQTQIFEEPLVPIGGEPTLAENAALAVALLDYSKRTSLDDFSSLTGFIEAYPESAWNAVLLTNLGLEYYNTGHYSKVLEVWKQAWELSSPATDLRGKALADRALGELVYMHARLGHIVELESLLKSVEGRVFMGSATEKITGAREGLSNMKTYPENSFKCGPHALHQILRNVNPNNHGIELIHQAASTQQGFSLQQLEGLSSQLGLNYQMAFREKDVPFIIPSVVHLKVDHYAAMIRQQEDFYLLQDPTFGNNVWVTRVALEDEASGYFLVPPGELPDGWRVVEVQEGETVWGKGNTGKNDPDPTGCDDPKKPKSKCDNNNECKGLAVPDAHLMLVSLNINDEPVGYVPPVGPSVRFTVRYIQRESKKPGNINYSELGKKWTFDWL